MPTLNSFMLLTSEHATGTGIEVLCFPIEGAHFTLSAEEFLKQYPHLQGEYMETILKVLMHSDHNYTQLF